MVVASACDLVTMKIPNKISLVLVAAFLVAAPLAGMSAQTIGAHLLTGFAVLAAGFAMFSRGWLGGGDAKLLAAASLWIGSQQLLMFLLTVTVCGGALCLALVLYRRLVPSSMITSPSWLARLHSKDVGVPYGLAIGLGALMLYPKTPYFAAFAV
ncbi:MAG: prepilin peptidase [Hyphomicrobiaceae bacterium]|nr:prepilin peptidase [Hyphomicrobiaceae bacterium]